MDIIKTNQNDQFRKRLCGYIHENDVIVIRKYSGKLYCTVIPEGTLGKILHVTAKTPNDIITIRGELLTFESEKDWEATF